MSLNNSPSLQGFSPIAPEEKPMGKKRSWTVIAILFVVVIALAAFNFLRSDQGATVLRGSGSISGRVVDMNGTALEQAEVFVENGNLSVRTDANGNFLLEGVAVGEHVLVAGYEGIGVEHTVMVTAGRLVDAGTFVIDIADLNTVE